MIHVIAVITANPGRRDELLRHFRANMPVVQAEQGCIEYGPAIDADPGLSVQTIYGPDTFVVIEKWASMDALKAHGVAPHMKEYAAKIRELVAGRAIHVLTPA